MSLCTNGIRFFALAVLGTLGSNANALTINASGNFGAAGYAVMPFTVTTPGIIDISYTGGFEDPTISLFDASGAHLVTNDDKAFLIDGDLNFDLFSRITQSLSAGSYSLLVSFCCSSLDYVTGNGSVYADVDGFNSGSFEFGGSGTLAGMQTYLDSDGYIVDAAIGAPYALTITDAIPEPETYLMMLVGLGLVGMAANRRVKHTLAANA